MKYKSKLFLVSYCAFLAAYGSGPASNQLVLGTEDSKGGGKSSHRIATVLPDILLDRGTHLSSLPIAASADVEDTSDIPKLLDIPDSFYTDPRFSEFFQKDPELGYIPRPTPSMTTGSRKGQKTQPKTTSPLQPAMDPLKQAVTEFYKALHTARKDTSVFQVGCEVLWQMAQDQSRSEHFFALECLFNLAKLPSTPPSHPDGRAITADHVLELAALQNNQQDWYKKVLQGLDLPHLIRLDNLCRYNNQRFPLTKDFINSKLKLPNIITAPERIANDVQALIKVCTEHRHGFPLYFASEHLKRNHPVHALNCLQVSASLGYVTAQSDLGTFYLFGHKNGNFSVQQNQEKGLALLHLAAKQGFPEAQLNLREYYRRTQSPTLEILWLRQAAQRGHSHGQTNLGACYLYGNGVSRDPLMAIMWFIRAADQNEKVAQYNLATCYAHGYGVDVDFHKAKKLFELAAKQGHFGALTQIGLLYFKGKGVPKDLKRAIQLFREAAIQGNPEAQYNLGLCYLEGVGVPKDLVEAERLVKLAAIQGHTGAQCILDNLGVDQDHKRTIELLKKAAEERKDPTAQYNLGLCYYVGKGVDIDKKQAATYFRLAAKQGNIDAQAALAECYYKGEGMDHDDKKAAKWVECAAQQGHKGAQYNIGLCYTNGIGVEKNHVKAKQWFKKAANQGDVGAIYRLGLLEDMEYPGHRPDPEKAFHYYLEAAGKGHGNAMVKACFRSLERASIVKSPERELKAAYYWLKQAEAKGTIKFTPYLEMNAEGQKQIDEILRIINETPKPTMDIKLPEAKTSTIEPTIKQTGSQLEAAQAPDLELSTPFKPMPTLPTNDAAPELPPHLASTQSKAADLLNKAPEEKKPKIKYKSPIDNAEYLQKQLGRAAQLEKKSTQDQEALGIPARLTADNQRLVRVLLSSDMNIVSTAFPSTDLKAIKKALSNLFSEAGFKNKVRVYTHKNKKLKVLLCAEEPIMASMHHQHGKAPAKFNENVPIYFIKDLQELIQKSPIASQLPALLAASEPLISIQN
jgi:TPR repeat protein